MRYDTLVMLLGSSSEAAPSQSGDHKDKQLVYLQPFYTHTAILFFPFSTVFNKLHEILSTYYNIGFVLDDFSQL